MGYTTSEYGYLGGFASLTVGGVVKGSRFLAGVDSNAAPGFSYQAEPDKGMSGPTTNLINMIAQATVHAQYVSSTSTVVGLLTSGNATLGTRVIYTPPVAQSITGVGVAIAPTARIHEFTSDGNYTLTVAPTIANGTDGQLITLVNVGANTVTIQDQGTLASSNLRLTGASVAIGPRDSVNLYYSGDVGDWVQIGPLVAVV